MKSRFKLYACLIFQVNMVIWEPKSADVREYLGNLMNTLTYPIIDLVYVP